MIPNCCCEGAVLPIVADEQIIVKTELTGRSQKIALIINGPYMIIYGPYMIIYGPYMIIYGPYMIICGPYMIICG